MSHSISSHMFSLFTALCVVATHERLCVLKTYVQEHMFRNSVVQRRSMHLRRAHITLPASDLACCPAQTLSAAQFACGQCRAMSSSWRLLRFAALKLDAKHPERWVKRAWPHDLMNAKQPALEPCRHAALSTLVNAVAGNRKACKKHSGCSNASDADAVRYILDVEVLKHADGGAVAHTAEASCGMQALEVHSDAAGRACGL